MIVKKYGNRRMYDPSESRYITLEELGEKVRSGVNVTVLDAKTGEDLTQATLTQIILEMRGGAHLLPVSVLTQLVRLGDDALAEFLGRYVAWSLEVYLQIRQNAGALMPFNPLLRMLQPWSASPPSPPPPIAPPPPQPAAAPAESEIDELRRELDELKKTVKGRRRG